MFTSCKNNKLYVKSNFNLKIVNLYINQLRLRPIFERYNLFTSLQNTNMTPKKIVIFASGGGTNAENIISYFKANPNITVVSIFCNNAKAGVIKRAENHGVPLFLFSKVEMLHTTKVMDELHRLQPDLIVLAGFLLKIPEAIINTFQDKIINIHPALLPKYGGKGMYGMNVHKAVVQHQEAESGITIHYINQHYDEGAIIFQAKCQVAPTDTAEDVASKIHDLEMQHFPKVIERLLN
jgi:phosphoribosylglycinamide formyltransferase-1